MLLSRSAICGCHAMLSAGLTSSMYLPTGSCDAAEEVACPAPDAGLVVRTHGGDVVPIQSRPDQLLFQSGLTLQLLSGGILKSTEHAVLAPKHVQHGVTRNTFAVFCQPKCALHAAVLCTRKGVP